MRAAAGVCIPRVFRIGCVTGPIRTSSSEITDAQETYLTPISKSIHYPPVGRKWGQKLLSARSRGANKRENRAGVIKRNLATIIKKKCNTNSPALFYADFRNSRLMPSAAFHSPSVKAQGGKFKFSRNPILSDLKTVHASPAITSVSIA